MKCETQVLRHFKALAASSVSHLATLLCLMAICSLTGPVASAVTSTVASSVSQPVTHSVTRSATSSKSRPAVAGKPSVAKSAVKRGPASTAAPATAETEDLLRARLKKKSDDTDARVKLTQLLEKKRAWKELIELNENYVSTLPRAGLMPIAKAYEMQNDNLNEMRILKLCLAKDAKDFYCKTAEAQVLVRMKHNDDAIESYTAAKDMNPNFEPAYLGLMKQLELSGYNYEARDLIADMRKHFGNKPSYKSDLCRLYSKDAFLEKTFEACNEAIAIDKTNPLNFTYLATSLKERDDVDKAIAILKKGLKKFPKGVPILLALAKTEMEQKKFTEAYRDYKAAIGIDAKSLEGWIGYGKASLELQKFDDSLTAFDKACTIDRHAVGEYRTASKRLRDLKATSWEIKFDDHIYKCAPVY